MFRPLVLRAIVVALGLLFAPTGLVAARAASAPPVILNVFWGGAARLPLTEEILIPGATVTGAVTCTFSLFTKSSGSRSFHRVPGESKLTTPFPGTKRFVQESIVLGQVTSAQRIRVEITATNAGGSVTRVLSARRSPAIVSTAAAAAASVPIISDNWSGYVVLGLTNVYRVGGAWTIPSLDCSSSNESGIVTFVGLGAYSRPGLYLDAEGLQTGVTSVCDGGRQLNVGWWTELDPPQLKVSRT